MRRVIFLLIAIAVIVGVKVSRMDDDDDRVLVETKQVFQSLLTDYQTHAERVDTLIERYHPTAFLDAYEMGGRRTAASFDEAKYWKRPFQEMLQECRLRNDSKLIAHLEELRGRLLAPVAEG